MESNTINQTNHPIFKESYIENFTNQNKKDVSFVPNHPVAKMQQDYFKKEEMMKMKRYSELFGTGYAFQLCMERNMLANKRREFPLKSNNFALNIACGNYDKIEFNDFLGNDEPFDVDCSIFRQAENIYMNN